MKPLQLISKFKRSSLAPSDDELVFLHESIVSMKLTRPNVLEFGCGITTAVTTAALQSINSYVAVETFPSCIQQVSAFNSNVNIVDTWVKIPQLAYDLLIIDSSVGHTFQRDGVYRLEAFQHVEALLRSNCWIVVHDHHRSRKGYTRLRQYLDVHYELCSHCVSKSGFGVYRKRLAKQNRENAHLA